MPRHNAGQPLHSGHPPVQGSSAHTADQRTATDTLSVPMQLLLRGYSVCGSRNDAESGMNASALRNYRGEVIIRFGLSFLDSSAYAADKEWELRFPPWRNNVQGTDYQGNELTAPKDFPAVRHQSDFVPIVSTWLAGRAEADAQSADIFSRVERVGGSDATFDWKVSKHPSSGMAISKIVRATGDEVLRMVTGKVSVQCDTRRVYRVEIPAYLYSTDTHIPFRSSSGSTVINRPLESLSDVTRPERGSGMQDSSGARLSQARSPFGTVLRQNPFHAVAGQTPLQLRYVGSIPQTAIQNASGVMATGPGLGNPLVGVLAQLQQGPTGTQPIVVLMPVGSTQMSSPMEPRVGMEHTSGAGTIAAGRSRSTLNTHSSGRGGLQSARNQVDSRGSTATYRQRQGEALEQYFARQRSQLDQQQLPEPGGSSNHDTSLQSDTDSTPLYSELGIHTWLDTLIPSGQTTVRPSATFSEQVADVPSVGPAPGLVGLPISARSGVRGHSSTPRRHGPSHQSRTGGSARTSRPGRASLRPVTIGEASTAECPVSTSPGNAGVSLHQHSSVGAEDGVDAHGVGRVNRIAVDGAPPSTVSRDGNDPAVAEAASSLQAPRMGHGQRAGTSRGAREQEQEDSGRQ